MLGIQTPALTRWDVRMVLAAIACGTMLGLAGIVVYLYASYDNFIGYDAHAYWLAGRAEHPYGAAPGRTDAFLYTPTFLQVVWPLAQLPWPVFLGLWMVVETSAFVWLVRVLPIQWAVPVFLLATPEILRGNILGFLAVALVVGVTRPWPWVAPLLTKISPGLVGLAYVAAARDGGVRKAATAVGVTLLVVAVSFTLSPNWWAEWFDFITEAGRSSGREPAIRAAVCALVATIAARRGRPWVLVLAFMLSTPVLSLNPEPLAYLLAIPRLVQREKEDRAGPRVVTDTGEAPSARPAKLVGMAMGRKDLE